MAGDEPTLLSRRYGMAFLRSRLALPDRSRIRHLPRSRNSIQLVMVAVTSINDGVPRALRRSADARERRAPVLPERAHRPSYHCRLVATLPATSHFDRPGPGSPSDHLSTRQE